MSSRDEVKNELNSKLKTRFNKKFEDMNVNVYKAAKNDRGDYEVPVIIVGPGGGTLIKAAEVDGAVQLNPPAVVKVEFRTMKPERLIYRIALPYSECEIAAQNPAYFNAFFDDVLTKATNNYIATLGPTDKVRYGEFYIKMFDHNGVLRECADESFLELRLISDLASNQESYV